MRGGPPARFFYYRMFEPVAVARGAPPADARGHVATTMNEVEDRVAGLITGTLEAMGFELVRVRLTGGARPVLQIMAERGDGTDMTVENCAEISHAMSVLLDTEDPVVGAYTLEVSSPGIDRPLTRLRDFERFAGFEARIETSKAISGRRRFKGRLRGIVEGAEGMISMDLAEGHVELPFDVIAKADLILTDELIAASGAGQPRA